MSPLVVSLLAAASLGAVPPSIGSEPVPVAFPEAAPGAQSIAFPAPTLAGSLGSEPVAPGSEALLAPGGETGEASSGAATLATSFGSEPFPAGMEEGAAPAAREAARDQRLACSCCP